MEILFPPPSFSIQLPSSSSFLSDRTSAPPPPPPLPPDHRLDSPSNSFDYCSDSSSSIGNPDDSDDESVSSTGGDSEEVQSKLSLRSLEDSLPIKRGLSSHFSGKSKSFANLAEAKSVKDIEKPESSLNKRRRILIASKLAKKSSFYAWPNPKSMPLLTLREEEDDENHDEEESCTTAPSSSEDNEEDEGHERRKGKRVRDFRQRRLMSFKSRSFSMADLQQQQHHGIDRQQEQ